MRLVSLAAAAALVLTAGACATPSAEKSSAEGRAGAAAKAGAKAAGEKGKRKQPWWKLSQYSRPGFKPMRPDNIRPGPGLFSGKEGGFVLYRLGEAGGSSDPSKPTKVKR